MKRTKITKNSWDWNRHENPKGKPVLITGYVDADHAHDLVTRRSVTGELILLNSTPIKWYSKWQNTVETSTYGSELVAARIATELIMEMRYKLRMLGTPILGSAALYGDNQSVVLNTTVPSSALKKKIKFYCLPSGTRGRGCRNHAFLPYSNYWEYCVRTHKTNGSQGSLQTYQGIIIWKRTQYLRGVSGITRYW